MSPRKQNTNNLHPSSTLNSREGISINQMEPLCRAIHTGRGQIHWKNTATTHIPSELGGGGGLRSRKQVCVL